MVEWFRTKSVQETYSDEALALFAQHLDWDLADLERECDRLGIPKYREARRDK